MTTTASSFSLRFASIATAMLAAFFLLIPTGCTANSLGSSGREAPLTSAQERDAFRQLLGAALEHEALSTLVGGLKPLSTGFWRGTLDIKHPDTSEISRVSRALAPLRGGEYYADVQVFATAHDGQRHLEAYIVHLASLAAMIDREHRFWSPLGVSPTTHPAEILAVADRLPKADRWRAYGYLFGYPNYAVDFFVEASTRADGNGAQVGPGKDREFYHVPTASAAQGQFTWAVPIGHMERDQDREIRVRAAAVLDAYRRAASRIAASSDPLREVSQLAASTHAGPMRPNGRGGSDRP